MNSTQPELTLVESSNIAAIGFTLLDKPDEGTLTVRFNNGMTYTFEGVRIEFGRGIFEAESVGRYFNQNIRTAYQGVKLEVEEAE